METLLDWLQWILILGCVLPLVVFGVLAVVAWYFGRRWVEGFIEPDIEQLHAQFVAQREAKPDADREALIAPVVRRQAFKCGMVGAVTGFGGFVTLPVTLPIDLLLTARYQTNMVAFIAQVYGFESSLENKAATYAVMTGTSEANKVLIAMLQKYAPRLIGKSFSKLIPVLGAAIAFAVNYALARSMASAAIRWYSSRSREDAMQRASSA